ncbi:hypothetical protein BDN72DRAFT_879055 [Pluteus cervinus]|uniref:Uncharacterized protein n=1 Tax=Pluteus cervinus TaxID=181527 RepID=A0ACD3ARP0_9AGAR|nr:hypothetical protein BDN72DRAFT_879055 [Pluteus cervinus]
MPKFKNYKALRKIDYEITSLKRRIQDLRGTWNSLLPISSLPPYILTNIFHVLCDEYALKHQRGPAMRALMKLTWVHDLELDLGWGSPPLDRGTIQRFWISSPAPILKALTLRGLVAIPRESFLNRTRTSEGDPGNGSQIICDSPALRSLSLTWCSFSSSSLSHPFLTSLTIAEPQHSGSFGVSNVLRIISQMPSLETLKLVRAFTRIENDEVQDLPVVKTPSRFKSFTIEEVPVTPLIQMFRHLIVDNPTPGFQSNSTGSTFAPLHVNITILNPPNTAEVYSDLLRAIQRFLYPGSGSTNPDMLDGIMEIFYAPNLTFALTCANTSPDGVTLDPTSHSIRVQVNKIDDHSKNTFFSILKLFQATNNDDLHAPQTEPRDYSIAPIPIPIPIRIHTLALTSYSPRPVFDFLSRISETGVDKGIKRIKASYDAVGMIVDYLAVETVDDLVSASNVSSDEEGELKEVEEPQDQKPQPFPSLKSLHLLLESSLSGHSNPSSNYAQYSPSSYPRPHINANASSLLPDPNQHDPKWDPLCRMIQLRKECGFEIEWLIVELQPETKYTPKPRGRDGDWGGFKLKSQVGSVMEDVPVDWMKEYVGQVDVW